MFPNLQWIKEVSKGVCLSMKTDNCYHRFGNQTTVNSCHVCPEHKKTEKEKENVLEKQVHE